MKKKSNAFYVKLIIFIILLFISFRYNAFLGNMLISIFVLLQLYWSRALIYAVLGNNKYAKRDIPEALRLYKKASEIKNCRPRVKTTYAYLLLKEGYIEDSEKVLKKVMNCSLTPQEHSSLKLTYALVKWKQGSLDEAIDMVEEVHKTYRCSTAYESLGYLLILKGDYQRALELNLEAYDYNDSNDVIIDNLGETYYYLKDYDKSFEIYEKLIPKSPTFAEPYYYYGLLLAGNGRKEEALDMLEKALSCKESILSGLTKAKIEEEVQNIKSET